MLAKGSTQIASRPGAPGAKRRAPVADDGCPAIIAAIARSSAWNGGLAGSSPQPSRSVVWMARTSIGSRASSKRTGTSLPRSAASRASPRTQREPTEFGVQTTSTTLAALSSASMRSSNSCPGAISGSHQTDQPCASIAATSGATRALSLRAYETKTSAMQWNLTPGRRGSRPAGPVAYPRDLARGRRDRRAPPATRSSGAGRAAGTGIVMPAATSASCTRTASAAADRHPVAEIAGPGTQCEVERARAEAR